MKTIIFLTLISLIQAQNGPIVKTPLGDIQGTIDKIINGRTIYSFEGVPYAKAPVGNRRFLEPQDVEAWEGVWQANITYKCMQYNQYTEPGQDFVIGDEDCLYLNIYSPDLTGNLNVIIYIHGGAFMFTHGGQLGPQILLEKDVILVKINYRLGPLGFLSTETDEIPGNNGLKDQIQALKWIQRYIKHFGGNANSITITGMSAGGASVHLHYLMDESKELFHRGHSQSGCALNPWVLMENAAEKTRKLASLLGCPSSKNVKCLKTRPARQIVEAVKHFQPWLYNPFSPFGIVVDSWASRPVLSQHPFKLLQNGRVKDAPWLISFTDSEGLYPVADFYTDQYLQEIDQQWNYLMPFILDYNATVPVHSLDAVSEKIRKYYFKGQKLTKNTYMELIKMSSDRLFVYDIIKAAKLHANAVKSPIYAYYFTYRGTHSQSEYRTKSTKNFGASHGDDTSYILKIDLDMLHTEQDKKMSNILVEMLTSFAKNGKPKVSQWTPLSKKGFNYLKIKGPNNMKMADDKLGNNQFWKQLPIVENEKIFENKDEL